MVDDKMGQLAYQDNPELGGSEEHTYGSSSNSYAGKGSEAERKLIFRQDLRIIPLCSSIYLLWYEADSHAFRPRPI